MDIQDLKAMLQSVGFEVSDTDSEGIMWTYEEHCYTFYPNEDGIFDSEGDLGPEITTNLEALRWYFKHLLLKDKIYWVMEES